MKNEFISYYIVIAKKEVILSAGAINSPQLLMLSGIGLKTVLDDFGKALILDFTCRITSLPKSRGRVKLGSNDPLTNALIYSNYFAEESDIQLLIKGLTIGAKLSRTNALINKGYDLITDLLPGCKSFTFGTEHYWMCALRTNTKSINHPVGTCKMGLYNDTDAVVDPQRMIYGIVKFRVVDASIIPVIPRGNIIVPTIIIIEKGADMIKNKWQKS
ncbi:unnamed protein product [Timema podura]|uniref:Glucose-methanol-choline oxidoreductase N-terminal domain-containing protein n=1 Tax=Timema podura TaxID=61482 RepID=A0ABN7NVX4_TIMPD|nr:unnamed protein product [Timema podura]